MAPEAGPAEEVTRGQAVEATLWNTVARLRARGWHISLREIQRAQDVIAYLFARLERAPTDDELHRHLRPILCGRESELAPFSEAFQGSISDAPPADTTAGYRRRRRRHWLFGLAVAAVLAVLAGVAIFLRSGAVPSNPNTPAGGGLRVSWMTWVWIGVVVASAAAVLGLLWLAMRKRFRRRPAPRDPGHDLELRWATDHPLDTVECVRIARSLRIRARERGQTLDVRRTVDASIRAGLRLTPCFVEHKRLPEYLAVIEQRSAQDVLAAYHVRAVEQVGAHGVALRRVGLQPRTPLIVDPMHGRRRLETLQPTSERERLLLFAHDRLLRDPFSGRPRPWLSRFERWSETIQIGPDVDPDRALPVVDRVLTDVRCLDPTWAANRHDGRSGTAPVLPALFETGDELWIEPCAPSSPDVVRALDLLMTALGPDAWYWLSACALYPEISYPLTVALGRLLKGEHGEPVAAHLDVAVLARLPWFRHAYMPDWLRSSLISTLSQGQLVEARAVLDQILVSGLLGSTDGGPSLSVAEPRPGVGRMTGDGSSRRDTAVTQDRVYLDGSALRRRRLAAAAPQQLVAALRRQRNRFPPVTLPADAPAPRVRRALAWMNGLLAIGALVSSIITAVFAMDKGVLSAWWLQADGQSIEGSLPIIAALSLPLAAIALVFSLLSRRWRGAVVGGGSVIFLGALLLCYSRDQDASAEDVAVAAVALLAARLLTLVAIVAALFLRRSTQPVTWATFQGRNRIAFLAGVGSLIMAALAAKIGWLDAPASGIPILLGMFGGGAVLLAAAYFAGVRLIPLAVGGAVITVSIVAVFDATTDLVYALLFCPAALLTLGGFYWQLRRTAERPPLDFWETLWREWKWPLAVLSVAATVLTTWSISQDWTAALVFGAVPATFALLNLAYDLATDHLAGVVQRYRLGSWFPVHLD